MTKNILEETINISATPTYRLLTRKVFLIFKKNTFLSDYIANSTSHQFTIIIPFHRSKRPETLDNAVPIFQIEEKESKWNPRNNEAGARNPQEVDTWWNWGSTVPLGSEPRRILVGPGEVGVSIGLFRQRDRHLRFLRRRRRWGMRNGRFRADVGVRSLDFYLQGRLPHRSP